MFPTFHKLFPPSFQSADLFERSGGPHQLVDHVDGDPHEGGEPNEVSHCDAPVWVLIIKQCEGRRLQQGAHYDILRTVGIQNISTCVNVTFIFLHQK